MKNKNKAAGFTLIELLVVIAIIGLLASIVLVALSSTRMKARDTKRKADLAQIAKAISLYYDTNNAYPIPGQGWSYSSVPAGNWALFAAALAPYIKKLPVDPTNLDPALSGPWVLGNYDYAYAAQGTGYDLVTQLENTSDPDRCGVKNYYFFWGATPWCGIYSTQIYSIGSSN